MMTPIFLTTGPTDAGETAQCDNPLASPPLGPLAVHYLCAP